MQKTFTIIFFFLAMSITFAQKGNTGIINNGNTNTVYSKYSFFIPNIFTPNGDGINDDFQGFGQDIDEYRMCIFSIWGELLYETSDYKKPWNGKSMNSDNICPEGVYVYKFVTRDIYGETHKYYGQISLLR